MSNRRSAPLTAVALSVAALVGASCDTPWSTGPEIAPDAQPTAAAMGGMAMMDAGPVDILSFADGMTVMGWATLMRRPNGISMKAHMNAAHGETFTVWAVVFNKPDECATSPCGAADLGNPDVMPNVIHTAGGIVGGNGLQVAGHLRAGDASGGLFPGGPGIMDPMAVEIHFIYRSHGDRIPGLIDEQIHSVMGGCDQNVCTDVAFSVHLP